MNKYTWAKDIHTFESHLHKNKPINETRIMAIMEDYKEIWLSFFFIKICSHSQKSNNKPSKPAGAPGSPSQWRKTGGGGGRARETVGRAVPLFPFLFLLSAGTSLGLTGGSSRAALVWGSYKGFGKRLLVSPSIVSACAWEESTGSLVTCVYTGVARSCNGGGERTYGHEEKKMGKNENKWLWWR